MKLDHASLIFDSIHQNIFASFRRADYHSEDCYLQNIIPLLDEARRHSVARLRELMTDTLVRDKFSLKERPEISASYFDMPLDFFQNATYLAVKGINWAVHAKVLQSDYIVATTQVGNQPIFEIAPRHLRITEPRNSEFVMRGYDENIITPFWLIESAGIMPRTGWFSKGVEASHQFKK